jgi:tetratricopeptide (TPR) repeat protein
MAASLPVRSPGSLPWDSFWWPEAVTWHARGLGAAHLGDLESTAASIRRMTELEGLASAAGEALFATQIHILRLEVSAWEALTLGNRERAVALMSEAVQLEEVTPKHPVTPGATVPALEMLGDLHFEIGRYADAMREYTRASERTPSRLNTALGLARASVALGDRAAAARYYREVVDLAAPGSARAGAREARAYLETR